MWRVIMILEIVEEYRVVDMIGPYQMLQRPRPLIGRRFDFVHLHRGYLNTLPFALC